MTLIKTVTKAPYKFAIYQLENDKFEVYILSSTDKENLSGVMLGLGHYDIQACDEAIEAFAAEIPQLFKWIA